MGWKLVSSHHLCYTCRKFEPPVERCGRLAEAVTGEQREGKRRMARLTDEEFHAWCQRNKIEPETATYIQRLRTASPERQVRGRASNVSGRYPSQKMGFSIQFESQHVELWGCHTMERDEDVLEYYDQPTRPHPGSQDHAQRARVPRWEHTSGCAVDWLMRFPSACLSVSRYR